MFASLCDVDRWRPNDNRLSVSRQQLLVIDGAKLLRADMATRLCALALVADDLVSTVNELFVFCCYVLMLCEFWMVGLECIASTGVVPCIPLKIVCC